MFNDDDQWKDNGGWRDEDYIFAEKMLNWMLYGCVGVIVFCIAAITLLYFGKLV